MMPPLMSTDRRTPDVSGAVKFPVDANTREEPNRPTAAAQIGAVKGLRDLDMKPSTKGRRSISDRKHPQQPLPAQPAENSDLPAEIMALHCGVNVYLNIKYHLAMSSKNKLFRSDFTQFNAWHCCRLFLMGFYSLPTMQGHI
jgi:hypothetical protein